MKPHKHAEIIKAWADGAEIEMWCKKLCRWIACSPAWNDEKEYRVKLREIEVGATYPAVIKSDRVLAQCTEQGILKVNGYFWTAEYFYWIGEKLEIEWPESC